MDARLTYKKPNGAREDISPIIRRLVIAYELGALYADSSDVHAVEMIERDFRTLRTMEDGTYKYGGRG